MCERGASASGLLHQWQHARDQLVQKSIRLREHREMAAAFDGDECLTRRAD